ncbi:MAG: hypothetical protein QOH28_539, partial [Actinomycetota bacterium]|nr:hypothetical protein [Actinomycetota bacterium]
MTTLRLETAPRALLSRRSTRIVVPAAVIGAFAAFLAVVWGDPIASWWNFRIGPWIDSVEQWIILHRGGHWLFRWGFDPIARWLHNLVQWDLNILHFLTWPGLIALVVVVAARVSGIR